jgi:hypothetical protein
MPTQTRTARSAHTNTALAHREDALSDPLVDPLRTVQFDGNPSGGGLQETASKGIEGFGQSLPHLGTIQESFGSFDVSNVSAHTDGAARSANADMGSNAFATGSSIAFSSSAPDLHTSAHEAAHTVQQSQGVQLSDGIGHSGDAYERHADAVADTVVAGHSAEPLLAAGPTGAGGGGGTGIQFDDGDDAPVRAQLGQLPQDEQQTLMERVAGSSFEEKQQTVVGAISEGSAIAEAINYGAQADSGAFKAEVAGPAAAASYRDGWGALVGGNVGGGLKKLVSVMSVPPLGMLIPVASLVAQLVLFNNAGVQSKTFSGQLATEAQKDPQDLSVMNSLQYAMTKVGRRWWWMLTQVMMTVADMVTTIATMLSAGWAAPAMAAVKLIRSSIVGLKTLTEKVHGFFKWLRGDRGRDRQEAAGQILSSARAGNPDSLATIRALADTGYLAAGAALVGVLDMEAGDSMKKMTDTELLHRLDTNPTFRDIVTDRLSASMKSN